MAAYIYIYVYVNIYICISIYKYSISHIIMNPLQFQYRISKQIYGRSFIHMNLSMSLLDPIIRHMSRDSTYATSKQKTTKTSIQKPCFFPSLPFKHPKNQAFVFISSKHSHLNIHPKNPKTRINREVNLI